MSNGIDELKYKVMRTEENYIILFDKFLLTFCIHSKDPNNHVGMITGFNTTNDAAEFAENRIKELDKDSRDK